MPHDTSLPLIYSTHVVGRAAIDSDVAEALPQGLRWTLDLPRHARELHAGRPDVLLARLLDEPEFLAACHPMLQSCGLVVRLSHVVLRPQIAELLHLFVVPTECDAAKKRIRSLTRSIAGVVFVNRSRVDCRLSNLREVSPPEHEGRFEDTHPSSLL